MNINMLSENQKIEFLILIAKRAMSYMEGNSYFDLIKKSIDDCVRWSEFGEYSGEYFYEILDNEENGLAMLQYEDENEDSIELWNCIINAIAYVSRKAYEKERISFYPEPIQLVDEEIFKASIECLVQYNCEERSKIDEIYQKCISMKK